MAAYAFNPGEKNHPRFSEKLLLLGEHILDQMGNFFLRCSQAKVDSLIASYDTILEEIVKALRTPLEKRYQCAKQSNWRVAVNVLIKVRSCEELSFVRSHRYYYFQVLKEGLPLVRAHPGERFGAFWSELSVVLEEFLFPETGMDSTVTDDRMADEAVDCHLIELLRDEVIVHNHYMTIK